MTVRCENVLSKEILKTGDQLTKLNDTGRLESSNNYAKVRCSTTAVVLSSLLILSYIILNHDSCHFRTSLPTTCRQSCRVQFVESIPTGLNFSGGPVHRATHEAWLDLFNSANESIHIAALYWNLNSSEYPTAEYGRRVYEQLANAGRRGINIRIAQDASKGISDNEDSRRLAEQGLAEVRTLDFDSLLGSGVLHTKFIIVDMKDVYVGSANMDWKSLAEVKELGLFIQNCSCIAEDLHKIFKVYWHLGKDGARIPPYWPTSFDTSFNILSPMEMIWDGVETDVFISSSPAPFNTKSREHDLQTIMALISSAHRSVCVSVMDLIPQTLYMGSNNTYWPYIDDAIRSAAFRGVSVRLLVSHWDHSRPQMLIFLKSLVAITDALPKTKHGRGSIQVKLFTVPATEEQKKIPFARVNHNKYMVTDRTAYVGTSNWAGDYFINTAGVGVAMSSHGENGMVQQLQAIFDRDWESPYATEI